jgi:hypothetical protein
MTVNHLVIKNYFIWYDFNNLFLAMAKLFNKIFVIRKIKVKTTKNKIISIISQNLFNFFN